MTFNRSGWQFYFDPGKTTQWRCGSCRKGHLASLKETVKKFETAASIRAAKRMQDWHPDMTEGRFTARFRCSQCKEVVGVVGSYDVAEVSTQVAEDDWDMVQTWTFRPWLFTQAPVLFEIPHKTPTEVRKRIEESFSLLWCDRPACGNRIRTAVEDILTDRKITRFKRKKGKGKKGRLIRRSLHERIKEFEAKELDLANQLMAIKWLGNAGSHPGALTDGDLLDAYQILSHAIDELYSPQSKQFATIVKTIVKSKKPRSARKRRRKRKKS